jgi:rhodanese-related sulfurtransferase
VLPDKNALILIYCRSGMRAGTAAKQLDKMGYTKVFSFGGIMNWPYEIVRN